MQIADVFLLEWVHLSFCMSENYETLTVSRGVNPYNQPDRKIYIFLYNIPIISKSGIKNFCPWIALPIFWPNMESC